MKPNRRTMRSKKIMKEAYKRDIWKKGGKLPEMDQKNDPTPMQIADLDNRLRIVRGKKKGPV